MPHLLTLRFPLFLQVVMITPTLLNSLKWKGYLIFMVLKFAFVPLVYFCYPETSNLTLEEIDWLFLEKDPVKASKLIAKNGWSDTEHSRRMAAVDEKGMQTESVAVERISQ